MGEQFSMIEALQARDEGIKRTREHERDWKERANRAARHLIQPGWRGTGEEIRRMLTQGEWVDPPHSDKVWGPLTKALLKDNFIVPTNDWKRPEAKKSHGRPTRIYERKVIDHK